MRFRSIPTEVEAVQWFPGKDVPGVSVEECWAEIGSRVPGVPPQRFRQPDRHHVVTIHGQRAYLDPGDYVITEPDGIHHYPCKPDIFEKKYRPAEAPGEVSLDAE